MDENTGALIIAISVFILEFFVIILQHLRETKYSKEIKTDTGQIKPKTDIIENNTDIIKNDIVRTVIPKVENLTSIQDNINELVERKHIEDRIKEQITPQINNSDYLIESIKLIYETNAASNRKIQELLNEKYLLQGEADRLKHKVEELTAVIDNYEARISELEAMLSGSEEEIRKLRMSADVRGDRRSGRKKHDEIGL